MGDQPATGTPSGESASRRQAPAHATRIDAVLRELSELRGRARRVLVLSAVLTGLAAVLLSLIGLGLVDFMLRLPWPVRFLALLGVLALGVWWYRTRMGPALRFRPTLTELALRVEARRPAGAEGTQTNALRHLLASGVDLAAESDEGDDDDRAARRRVLEALTRRWRRGATLNAVASKPAWTGSARAGGVVGLLLVLLVVAPTLVGIGAVRVLVPFAGAEWPKRQVVADVTGLQAHASDTALPLRAAVLRTNRGAGRTPVQAEWRVIVDGEASPWTRVALTGQGRWVTDAGSPAPRGSGGAGELYERLLDPAGFGRGEATQPGRVDARERLVEYRVITDDDATATQRVRLVDPPAVLAAEVNITPPGYASGLLGGDFARGDRELDPAEDGSVVIGPVLAGSRVRLLVMLNKAVGGALRLL